MKSRTRLHVQQRRDKPEEMLKPLSQRRILGAVTRFFSSKSSNTVSTDREFRSRKVYQQRSSWRQAQATMYIRHNQNR
ncbi:hypothetical protein KAH85_05275 [Candidatus Bathyarchaeota archaeon]|nr:hypothetical protein [Candidatus Bathyarchaeota archaeon]